MTQRDTLYSTPRPAIDRFAFDEQVVDVFPDMIQRSVPGYATIIAMTGILAGRYAQPHSRCYDLGCSLGASSLSMAQHIDVEAVEIIGVDNSPAMIERCSERAKQHSTPLTLRCESIQDTELSKASVVVLNFTLQFVPEADRAALLQRIGKAMQPGGILVLSEKIRFADPHLQELNTQLHHEFKRANGYSDMEIAQKRSALEQVLIPETLDSHRQRLKGAGFASIDVWFQCFNFASLVAIK
ncbi:carboxy-S-adenosyl-L-methionine synthase CmoA [Spongiibacter nanhainus]|uniref:Carboxy-S-adenosyl-L-methionine synthase n=1 Tax=Spongiibacter nanhainus TaxID=2794344 RepID=A0A7T4QZS8_9GAMM|nr:carboxy-S-adenosyl-L-methionine synthase CmoA [Spongiibacter nanhainus]QQD17657.1 carboxy-S-adenosyl-L-methionine synthase CmoA [Spongiibacter nanhainus]